MTISEMYKNNKEINELDENIANHTAVIASGKKVGEMYFEQLNSMKEKRSNMSVYKENQIDEKVSEYEKKVEEYEKNNKRMTELTELIESHNAMIASGRNVSEAYFKQIEDYKKELSNMKEIPQNIIMAYKRELAIAYKDKINTADTKNKEYDAVKEEIDNHKAVIASGRLVGEKYGQQLVNNENKIASMKRISKEDINKWKKIIDDVAKDDKETDKLKELIETQQSMMVAGIIGGKEVVKKQDELKKQLADRTISVKDIEEKAELENNKGSNNLPAIVEKQNLITKIKNSKIAKALKSFGSKISSLFSKKEEKIEEQPKAETDKAKEYRDKMKEDYQESQEKVQEENQEQKVQNQEQENSSQETSKEQDENFELTFSQDDDTER